jgi:hypothetical protein
MTGGTILSITVNEKDFGKGVLVRQTVAGVTAQKLANNATSDYVPVTVSAEAAASGTTGIGKPTFDATFEKQESKEDISVTVI